MLKSVRKWAIGMGIFILALCSSSYTTNSAFAKSQDEGDFHCTPQVLSSYFSLQEDYCLTKANHYIEYTWPMSTSLLEPHLRYASIDVVPTKGNVVVSYEHYNDTTQKWDPVQVNIVDQDYRAYYDMKITKSEQYYDQYRFVVSSEYPAKVSATMWIQGASRDD